MSSLGWMESYLNIVPNISAQSIDSLELCPVARLALRLVLRNLSFLTGRPIFFLALTLGASEAIW
jgi:hypothetical protein